MAPDLLAEIECQATVHIAAGLLSGCTEKMVIRTSPEKIRLRLIRSGSSRKPAMASIPILTRSKAPWEWTRWAAQLASPRHGL